jgi:hypothetical protein
MNLRVINNMSLLRKDKKLEVSSITPPTGSVLSKVDHAGVKKLKRCSSPLLETINKFWGPIVHEDQLCWGPFVHGDLMSWDCLFLGTNSGGPNVWGLIESSSLLTALNIRPSVDNFSFPWLFSISSLFMPERWYDVL